MKYDSYKDSGVDWLGEIPSHWEVKRIKFVFKEKNIRSTTGKEELLSLSKYHGLIPRNQITDKIESANSLINYKICSEGDLIINKLQAWNGMLDIAKYSGLVSPDYSVYENFFDEINKSYFKYLFKTPIYIQEFAKGSRGIGDGFFRLYTNDFFDIWSVYPPLSEQTAIAEFLDRKTAQIDQAIAQKERLIELLKERRQILIHNAVTRGVGKVKSEKLKTKSSGVDWIGEIPEHWGVRRLKYILKELNKRSETGEEELLSLSKYKGVIPKSDLEERAGQAQTLIGYKIVNKGNLVVNKMQAANGIIAVSKIEGITSPDYSIYKATEESYSIDYYGYLLVQPEYLAEYKKVSTGVMEGYIRLYTDDLFKIKAVCPSYEEQKVIVTFIETTTLTINTAILCKQKEIEKLTEYKAVLINSAVTGKIKVSDN